MLKRILKNFLTTKVYSQNLETMKGCLLVLPFIYIFMVTRNYTRMKRKEQF